MNARFHPFQLAILAAVVAVLAMITGCEKKAPTSAGATAKPLRVGFAQIGAESDWRLANTRSIQDEAKQRGIELSLVDAQGKQENQIKTIRTFIARKMDVIAFAPVVETGFEPVLLEAKKAGIPVILTDRVVSVSDPSLYVTFIGADFVEEGRRAAAWLADASEGKAGIVELQGTPGSAPAIDRKRGFEEGIASHPEMKILMSQSADFTRAKGREVMEACLKSPQAKEITAVYAHNDDMALGAIQAIEQAGLKPGTDIRIVSIDGVRAAFEAMAAGTHNCTVECTPLLGPYLFDAAEAIHAGRTVEKRIVTEARVFDASTAAAELKNRVY